METVPFDLDRFKQGEPAYSSYCLDIGILLPFYLRTISTSPDDIAYMNKHWRMAPPQEDGWIKHDGGPCPIPWAKAGQYELRYKCGNESIAANMDAANTFFWDHSGSSHDIIAWRLTDGWIPILDEKMPFTAKVGEVEMRMRSGRVLVNTGIKKAGEQLGLTVAVRRVKQEAHIKEDRPHKEIGITRAVKDSQWSEVQDPQNLDAKDFKYILDRVVFGPEFQKHMTSLAREWMCGDRPITLAEIRAAKPKREPVREIGQSDIIRIAGRAMDGIKQGTEEVLGGGSTWSAIVALMK